MNYLDNKGQQYKHSNNKKRLDTIFSTIDDSFPIYPKYNTSLVSFQFNI